MELKTHLQDYDDAILGYSKLLNFQPSESRQSFSYVDRGQVKVFSKDFKGAIDDYTKAIRINPDYSLSYYERGNVKYEIGDYDGAIIDYTQKINLDKSQDEKYSILYMVYWERGNAYAFNDQYKKAIDDYTKSIQIAPYSFSPSYRNRGFAKEKLGNIGGACEDMRIATNLGDETAKKWVADKCK